MADFSYLEALDVNPDDVRSLTLPITINGRSPKLFGRHAGESNEGYWREQMKAGLKSVKAVSKGKLTEEMVKEALERDIELFSSHVITDWADVIAPNKASGKVDEVKFTRANCKAFLAALPRHVLEDVRQFFGSVDNFAASSISIEAVEEKAKN